MHIADWDFRWQHVYRYAAPIKLPKGTRLSMEYTYDNSASNVRNPELPPARVFWGQRSKDEMGDLWFQLVAANETDRLRMTSEITAKMTGEDIVGYETMLKVTPNDAELHDDVALLYLGMGFAANAVRHFQASALLKPQSAAAQFNLGTAQAQAGRFDEAIRSLREALQLRPDYALAHGNLGRVLLVNDEAKRLLDLDDSVVGRPLADVVPSGHVRDVVDGTAGGPDEVVLVNDRVLVANRMPVVVRGRDVGAVVTLRDRTELEGLLRELHDVRSLADALRAQEHEFSHRLHVVAGLIELGRSEDAIRFINQSSDVYQALVESIVEHVGEPTLAALLLGKAAVASERGIELRVTEDSQLPEDYDDARDLVTVVGNLVDNALDSVASVGGGTIEVTLREEAGGVLVQVRDSGPGIDPSLVEEIFRDGFTTKVANGTGRRGLGLALVSQTVRRREGGYVTVTNDGGARFVAFLPRERLAEAAR